MRSVARTFDCIAEAREHGRRLGRRGLLVGSADAGFSRLGRRGLLVAGARRGSRTERSIRGRHRPVSPLRAVRHARGDGACSDGALAASWSVCALAAPGPGVAPCRAPAASRCARPHTTTALGHAHNRTPRTHGPPHRRDPAAEGSNGPVGEETVRAWALSARTRALVLCDWSAPVTRLQACTRAVRAR